MLPRSLLRLPAVRLIQAPTGRNTPRYSSSDQIPSNAKQSKSQASKRKLLISSHLIKNKGQEIKKINVPFASHRDHRPVIAIFVRFLFHLGRKCNGTHDAVPKLLCADRLVSIAIILDHLEQAIDQGIFGRHLKRPATVGELGQLLMEDALLNVQHRRQLLDILLRRCGLPIEDGGDGHFAAAEFFGNLFEADLFLRLALE